MHNTVNNSATIKIMYQCALKEGATNDNLKKEHSNKGGQVGKEGVFL